MSLLLHTGHPRRFASRLAVLGLLVVLPLACAGGDDGDDARRTALEQQRRQLLDQFAVAQNQVRNTQARALADPGVEPLRDRFYELLRERMIEIEPRAGAWLDRARELGAEIDELSQPQILEPGQEPTPREERVEVVEEFAELERALQPVQQRAMADPAVAAAFTVFQDSVHARMVEINPDAASALDRMRRASAAVDSIDAELRALED